MSKITKPRARQARTKVIVDKRFQLSWIATIVFSMFVATAAVSIYTSALPAEAFSAYESPNDIRGLVLRLNAGYFLVCAALVGTLMVFLTHRVAGAAGVLRRAIEGYKQGDFDGRTKLRRRDELQDLATELGSLGKSLQIQERRQREILERIDVALSKGEIEAARNDLATLRGASSTQPELVHS